MTGPAHAPYAEVIGDPVAQSRSPAIHRFWLGKLGLDGDYRACPVSAAGLASYLAERRADPVWRGCNVTMPHKQAIVPLLDGTAGPAAAVGAVNTVVPAGNGLIGHNTDGAGFLEPLLPLLAQTHRRRLALVMGAGGAARAIVAALAGAGFAIVLAARDPARARALLADLAPGTGHHAAALADFATPTTAPAAARAGVLDLVVNASPLGMAGQPPLALDFSHVSPGSVVYDIVTHPHETPLLAEARRRGLPTIDGLAMLIGQAAAAFELFFGQPAPRGHDAELRDLLTR